MQYPCFGCITWFVFLCLLKALMNVNTQLRELYPDNEELFDIVLMTNNHAQVGVRLINSINHYGMLRRGLSVESDVGSSLAIARLK